MTKEELFFLIETKKSFEFKYNGVLYNMTYDKDSQGRDLLVFGRLYEGKVYKSFGEFMNTAKIENHNFKDMLESIHL